MRRPYHRVIALDPLLFSTRPDERLRAARWVGRGPARALVQGLAGWPAFSPAAINAGSSSFHHQASDWRDPLMSWVEHAPTVGEANEGFVYLYRADDMNGFLRAAPLVALAPQ